MLLNFKTRIALTSLIGTSAFALALNGICFAAPVPPKSNKSSNSKALNMAPTESPSMAPTPEIDRRSLELNEQGVAAVKAKSFKIAEDLFLRALGADQQNMTAAYNLAAMYLTNKKNQQAIDLLTEYVNKGIKDPGMLFRLGDAYFASKNITEALKKYEEARRLDPKYPQLAARLGTLYSLTNRIPEAESMFLQAVEANPKDAASLGSLSSIFLANKKPEEAVRTAKRALQVRPSSEVYITLGAAYESLKDYKNSLIAFERAADLDTGRKDIQEKIESLKKRAA